MCYTALTNRALNLCWSCGDSVAILQHVVLGDRLAINAYEIIIGFEVLHMLLQKGFNRSAFINMYIICKPVKLSTNVTVRTRLQNRT